MFKRNINRNYMELSTIISKWVTTQHQEVLTFQCLVSISDKLIHFNRKSTELSHMHIQNKTTRFNQKFVVRFIPLFPSCFFTQRGQAFAAYNLGVLSLNSSNNSEESTCSIEAYLGFPLFGCWIVGCWMVGWMDLGRSKWVVSYLKLCLLKLFFVVFDAFSLTWIGCWPTSAEFSIKASGHKNHQSKV